MAKDKKSANAAKAVVQDMLPSAALWTSERRHKEDVGSIDANPRSEGCHPDDVDTAPSMRADPPATADGGAPGQPGKSDASPTSDAEPGGKEGVVNDCKKRFVYRKRILAAYRQLARRRLPKQGGRSRMANLSLQTTRQKAHRTALMAMNGVRTY